MRLGGPQAGVTAHYVPASYGHIRLRDLIINKEENPGTSFLVSGWKAGNCWGEFQPRIYQKGSGFRKAKAGLEELKMRREAADSG